MAQMGISWQERLDRVTADAAAEAQRHTTAFIWGPQKNEGDCLEFLIIRIMVFGGLYWGPPIWEKSTCRSL